MAYRKDNEPRHLPSEDLTIEEFGLAYEESEGLDIYDKEIDSFILKVGNKDEIMNKEK